MTLKKYTAHKFILGFTLIEVMVALAILAVASASLIKVASQSLRQSASLEERTLAYWVAENKLTQMQLDRDTLSVGDSTDAIVMAGRDWEVKVHVIETSDPDLKRADVSVKLKENPKSISLASLTGFIGKH